VRRVLVPVTLLVLSACGLSAETAAPRCESVERVAIVAQSVPTAAYVPCLRDLPAGWQTTEVAVRHDTTRITLLSDRSGDRPVQVVLQERCDLGGASTLPPRAEGVRSAVRLESVSPLYRGVRYDVFPGGCVRSTFAFPRGAHIPLMEELTSAVDLLPRRELRVAVRDELGVELDP
jgi:hypothetical protein